MKPLNLFGYVLAVVIVSVIVLMGRILIKTDGQLAVVLTGMITLILLMSIVTIYLRLQRCTHRNPDGTLCKYSVPFTYVSPLEQKFFQGGIVLAISMILLGIIQKGPKVWHLMEHYFNK